MIRRWLTSLFVVWMVAGTALAQSTAVKIWDGTDFATVTGGALDVNATVSTVGLATSAKQDTGNTSLASIDGKITACNTGAVVVSSGSLTCNAGTNLNTSALATEATLSTLNGKVTACNTGAVTVSAALPAGNNNIGDVDVATIAAGNNNIGDVDVASIAAGTNTIGGIRLKPDTAGGYTIARFIDLDESDQQIKGTAGQLYGYYFYNNAASTRYVKLYNATAASVTVGSTTPVITIGIPAGSAANVEFATGIAFSTAITAACLTGVADADTGAPGANDCVTNFFYN